MPKVPENGKVTIEQKWLEDAEFVEEDDTYICGVCGFCGKDLWVIYKKDTKEFNPYNQDIYQNNHPDCDKSAIFCSQECEDEACELEGIDLNEIKK